MEPTYLFVYGTLKKRGDAPASPLSLRFGIRVIGEHMPAVLYDHTLYLPNHKSWPLAVRAEGRIIQGEVIELAQPEWAWPRLDSYEGVHSGLYTRERMLVDVDGVEGGLHAHVYLATAQTIRRYDAVEIGAVFDREAYR